MTAHDKTMQLKAAQLLRRATGMDLSAAAVAHAVRRRMRVLGTDDPAVYDALLGGAVTSKDLLNWDYKSTLKLVNNNVIDATVYQLPNSTWRLWYNNEKDGKTIYYADSKDLENWDLKGKVIEERGEGPKVFRWKGKYWMLVDNWSGMSFYSSDDATNWVKQSGERILELPGKGDEDQAIGGHADVVVSGDRAFVYYFTHPGRVIKKFADNVETRRSVIQVAELEYKNGILTVDRDKAVYVKLDKKETNSRK